MKLTGHSHIAALTDGSPAQHFRRLPLPQLHVLYCPHRTGLCPPAVGRAQSPQLGGPILTHQNAAGSYVAMDAALSVQVLLDEVQTRIKV